MRTTIIILSIYFFVSTNLAGVVLGQVKYNIRSRGFLKGYLFMLFLGPLWALHTFVLTKTRHLTFVSWAVYYYRLFTGKFSSMSQKNIDKVERDISLRDLKVERIQWEKIKSRYGYNPSRKLRRALSKVK